MNKNDIDSGNTEETIVEEKTLVFNPGGFFLKMIVSVAAAIMMTWSDYSHDFFLFALFTTLTTFVALYAVASLFGFVLRLSGNYLIAIVLFIIAVFGYMKLFDFVTSKGAAAEIVFNIVFIVVTIALLVRDIRKAVLYFKYVV